MKNLQKWDHRCSDSAPRWDRARQLFLRNYEHLPSASALNLAKLRRRRGRKFGRDRERRAQGNSQSLWRSLFSRAGSERRASRASQAWLAHLRHTAAGELPAHGTQLRKPGYRRAICRSAFGCNDCSSRLLARPCQYVKMNFTRSVNSTSAAVRRCRRSSRRLWATVLNRGFTTSTECFAFGCAVTSVRSTTDNQIPVAIHNRCWQSACAQKAD